MADTASLLPGAGKANRNARRRAIATTLNAMSVAVVISAVFQPLTSGNLDIERVVLATGVFIVLQIVLHYVLARVED
jgi:hypothetical protein